MTISKRRAALALLGSTAMLDMQAFAAVQTSEPRYNLNQQAQDPADVPRQFAGVADAGSNTPPADLAVRNAPAKDEPGLEGTTASLVPGTKAKADVGPGSTITRDVVHSATPDDSGEEPIVVTGSHIRGAQIASPVITVGRDSIEKAGQNDLGEVARSIPQNFSGGQNPGIGTGGGLANGNLDSSSQLNLRGLGPDATLTLLNGHRLPYGGAFAGIDISAIPVAAVERLEIVPDGASAQYGSDAVAGVANIILRRDFEGLTTTARLGAASSGGTFQQGADAVAGTGWSNGHIMLAYQFAKNTAITARQRDFAGSLPQGNDLYPSIRQHGAILSGRQTLGSGVDFSMDIHFSDRRSRTIGGNLTAAGWQRLVFSPTARSFSIAPELAIELGGDWMARASIVYGKSKSLYHSAFEPTDGPRTLTTGCFCNSALNAELLFDGSLFALPGGDVRVGFGGGYRSNALRYSQIRDGTLTGAFDVNRDSHFFFGEANIPVISPAQQLAFVKRLTATAALRYEDYPGMGRVTTPKLGLVYEPVHNITIKASWGRSFKAPTLYQQYVGYETYLLPAGAYGAAPSGTILYTSGGNPSLRPERARSWSAGITFEPTPALRLWAGYFNVRYRDRVAQPVPGSIASAFSDPGYATLIDRDPSPDLLTDLIEGSLSGLTNFTDEAYDPAAVAALVDNRNRNIARQDIEGVDLGASYRLEVDSDRRLDVSGSLTYLQSEQQLADALPGSQLAGTVFNPPHWRSRVGLSWQGSGYTISAFGNYTGKLADRRFATVTILPSALTLDLTAQIAVGSAPGRPPAVDLTLVVNNLFNDRPPAIRTNGSSDTPYDSTNYSPIGRFLGVKVSRTW
jgi:outer membrane receptor protein involved in Fe transport